MAELLKSGRLRAEIAATNARADEYFANLPPSALITEENMKVDVWVELIVWRLLYLLQTRLDDICRSFQHDNCVLCGERKLCTRMSIICE